MRRLVHLNLDFDDELAAGAGRSATSSHARAISRALAPLALWLGGAEDAVLGGDDVALVRRELASRGVAPLPAVVAAPPVGVHALLPWGFTEGELALARTSGARVTGPSPAAVRRVADRSFGLSLATRLDVALAGSAWACSVAELAAHVASLRGAPFVLKARHAAAGRRRRVARGELDGAALRWAERVLAEDGGLLLEPWCERVLDASAQLEVGRDGAVELLGLTELVTTHRGGYLGSRVGVLSFSDEERARLLGTALAVGGALAAEGYHGPAGVDAFLYRDGDERTLHPLCEVNPRFTFGRVALEMARRLGADALALRCVAVSTAPAYRELADRLPPDALLTSATPPLLSLVVTGADRATLLAREAEALSALAPFMPAPRRAPRS